MPDPSPAEAPEPPNTPQEGRYAKRKANAAVAGVFVTAAGVIATVIIAFVFRAGPSSASHAHASGHQSLGVSIPKEIPYCNTFKVIGTPPSNGVLLMYDRYVDASDLPVPGQNWSFDGAAISTPSGWIFKDAEIGAGVQSDKGDHHEIAIVLVSPGEYTTLKKNHIYRTRTDLPEKPIIEKYAIRNSISQPCSA